jgi:hypothetical protein
MCHLNCDTIVLKPFLDVFECNEFFAVSENAREKVFLMINLRIRYSWQHWKKWNETRGDQYQYDQ